MRKNFFTTYEMTEPPPIARRTTEFTDNFTLGEPVLFSDYFFNTLTQDPLVLLTDPPEIQNFEETPSNTPSIKTSNTSSAKHSTKNNNRKSIMLKIVDTARSFVGTEYLYGGKSPGNGFDCSGLISYAFNLNGINLGRSTFEIFKSGKEVKLKDAKIGDIICTPGSGDSGRHVKLISNVDENGITVIEARGRNKGIVERHLDKTDNIISIRRISENDIYQFNPTTTKSTGAFSSRTDFIKSMLSSYKKALIDNGMDPNYAYTLTASAAIESGWGTKVSGKFNYGGVKAKTGTVASTIDYVPGQGNIRRNQTFRDFESLDDYCSYMIKWLKSSNRYKNAFKLYSADLPIGLWRYVLEAGYGGGSQQNINNYMTTFRSVYNNISKYA